jgi:ParB-like chromosome segregation protein Spo0J
VAALGKLRAALLLCSTFSRGQSVAENAAKYTELLPPDTVKKIDGILDSIRKDELVPDELVLVEDQNKKLVIIEGNHRAIAFMIANRVTIPAIVGKSPRMHQWRFIGSR